ncbi:hypothetical protein [Oceanobacillus indicireducens]|uniref:Uncharacterized protein n=1 Tax=Oceanobacillus indicireducens TaxID=1004261 RepID=A0A917Y579_9BACI|nr:hypothetical protein [Oceanobacillus indicireducens]GGN65695.1 hypothetical protein GCM10007971_34820 [Oceanobacillus indicireducens]
MMKKQLKILASIFLLSGFLVACADAEDPAEEPMTPDVPGEETPDGGVDPSADTDEGL